MKLDKIAKYSLIAVLTSSISGIAYGAESNLVVPGVTDTVQSTSTPQIDAAIKRVDTAKTNLDMAHKRLDASKALLKAAEAEFRAAKTDKDALVLTTQAQQLADASGLPKNGENIPTPPAAVTNAAVNQAAAPVYNNSESTIDSSAGGAKAPVPSAQ